MIYVADIIRLVSKIGIHFQLTLGGLGVSPVQTGSIIYFYTILHKAKSDAFLRTEYNKKYKKHYYTLPIIVMTKSVAANDIILLLLSSCTIRYHNIIQLAARLVERMTGGAARRRARTTCRRRSITMTDKIKTEK